MKRFICIILSIGLTFSLVLLNVSAEKITVNVSSASKTTTASTGGVVSLSNSARYTEVKTGSGKNIYVSASSGSDNGDGSNENPYKTIAKAKENLKPGDTIILKSGIYNEKFGTWQANGTESEPYTIMGEKGADVAITSYDPITTDWAKYSDNIYVTNIGKYTDISHALWFNNNNFYNMVEARWPNADPDYMLDMTRAYMGAGTNASTLYSSELPQGDWNGATVYTWTGQTWEQYVAFTRKIANYKAGESLTFSKDIPGDGNTEPTYCPHEGGWFYLTNSLAGLDAAREYYYDSNTGNFYVIMADGETPSSSEIWVETRDYSIELWSSSYMNFANLNIVGGGVRIADTSHCTLTNVNVYYSDWFRDSDGYATMDGKYNSTCLSGEYNKWINSEIAYTMGNGIFITSSYNTVENCMIHDVNITGGYNSAITINANVAGTTIRYCSMYRSGRFLIYFAYNSDHNDGYPDTLIEYNDLYSAMYLTQDGGLIYAYHRNGKGVTIRNNWVHDTNRAGARGIYIDNECSYFEIYRNVVWNICEAGLVLNTYSEYNKIFQNTIVNCGEGIQVWPKYAESSMVGTQIRNNIITSKANLIEGALAPTLGINIFNDEPPLDNMLVPVANSSVIDSGEIIEGYNDNYIGAAPDLGAYEYGGEYWIAGAKYLSSVLYGDVDNDGNINGKDVLLLKQYFAEWDVVINKDATDVNVDGFINAKDSLLIKQYIAEWNVVLG